MGLLERQHELSVLDRAARQAATGDGRVVVVSGEAGVGKTSLVRAFLADLPDGVDGWFGACDDLVTPRPLGPFVDMARAGPTPFDLSGRDAIIDGALRTMHERPIAIVVDDVQWADDATLDVLSSIGRRIADLRGLLVLSVRNDDLPDEHPLHRVLARLSGQHTIRVTVQPLSLTGLQAMIDEAGSQVEPGAVLAATGGNPFYAMALLQWSGDGVPPSIRDVVRARRRSLPERTQRTVDLLSVIPGEVDHHLLEALAIGHEELEHAERAGLVTVTARGVAFRHQLTRAALSDELSDSRRRHLHGRVLDALASLDDQPARLVHHAVGAADGRRIVQHGSRALEDAVRAGAHREVVAHARAMLGHDELLDRADEFRIRMHAAEASLASNRFVDAAEFASAADRRADGKLEHGSALTTLARAEMMLGAAHPARMTAERAVTALELLGDTPELLRAVGLLAQHSAAHDDFPAGVEWSGRALELAGRLSDAEAGALARTYLGLCRLGLGDESGLSDVEAALAAAERDGYRSAWRIANNLGVVLMRWGRLDDAAPVLERAAVLAVESGADFPRLHAGTQIAVVQLHRGDWVDAERRLRAILARGVEGVTLAPLLGALGRLLARRGDDESREHIERAWRVATSSGESNRLASAGAALLEQAWIDGDDGRVAHLAEQLVDHATVASHHYLAAEACRYGVRVGAAIDWSCPSPTPALAAFDAGLRGDWRTAAERWSAAHQPYEQALELTEADDEAAANDGLAILDDLGAVATAARVRRQLRERGRLTVRRGPQPATRANRFGLTRRQSEVLELISDGLTNAQIADRLFVSVRTVDHHVSAILTRLGVSTRVEAAAMSDDGGEGGDGHGETTLGTHE